MDFSYLIKFDDFFQKISLLVGFPTDQLRFFFCLLICYPAAFIFQWIPVNKPNFKHCYSIFLSIFFVCFCLGKWAWIHSFASSFIAYLICWKCPHEISHKIVFIWSLGYLSISHLYRQYIDYMGWTLDFTTMQMVITIKLSSFAFNYYDGNSDKKLTKEQEKRSIKQLPSLLEFFGFIYFFPSFLAGPAIEITEYQNFISLKMFQDNKCNGKIPSTFFPALKPFFIGLFFIPLMILGSSYFPFNFFLTKQFFDAPFYEKLWRVYVHTTHCRFKYYFGWFISEGTCNAIGIGYNGFLVTGDGEKKKKIIKWDRCRNVDFFKVECAPNIHSVTTWWNIRTGDWLKHYVYLRLTPEGKKPTLLTTICTYSVSAFWHGFYPGYYIFFLTASIYTEVAKDIRKLVRPFFMKNETEPKYPYKYIYDFLTIIVTSWFLNYGGLFFLLLSFERAWIVLKSLYFFGHITSLSSLFITRVLIPKKKFKEKEKEISKTY